MNHVVRAEDYRYIRYADGGEEFYNERKDPYEWTNLVGKAELTAQKADLGKFMPEENKPDIGGRKNAGAEEGMPVKKGKRGRK
jgi:hypothetical protein